MNKTYAITDLHGQYDLWEQIKNYCDDTDTIYCLGDCADRGPRGLDIILEALEDPRVVYLCGNHEEMFEIVMSEYLKTPNHKDDLYWWECNGGGSTYEAALKLPLDELRRVIKDIAGLPRQTIYTNKKGQIIHLSHAGTALDYSRMELHYYEMKHMDPLLWDRKHFIRNWPEGHDNEYIVHGHTPIPYMFREWHQVNLVCNTKKFDFDINKVTEICEYSDGHKFNLDLGCFMTGVAALFDLDELKVEKYFYKEDKENEGTEQS